MLTEKQKEALRALPAVSTILQLPEVKKLIESSPLNLVSDIISKTIEIEREKILQSDTPTVLSLSTILEKISHQYKRLTTPHLRSVVNGTGVILHTNLGRAKLSNESILAAQLAATDYTNLEYTLSTGKRGSRYDHVEDLLVQLTGAEAALVVNNNASAVILILKEMAQGKEVIVSRGQLVEIGGSFRVSEIMAQSGAHLMEVGTTNKTHRYDYERAITDQTGLLMKVHTSNFKIIGFTKEVCLKTLVEIGKEHQIPVYEDLGSGVLYDFKKHGIGNEPTVQETVKAGADLVSFSGDKLLGGPQAGIIVGKKKWIDRLKKNQLTRSLRVDKMTLAALEATLRHYLLEEAQDKIPTLKMILMKEKIIEEKSEKLYSMLKPVIAEQFEMKIIDGFSEIGGGSMPDVQLLTKLISIKPKHIPVHRFEEALRITSPHIIGRISDEQFFLDVRTIEPKEFDLIVEKIQWIAKN
ncbi:L-seryl-tRNA(Sec) selenium transferase [Tepidibacillus infernus]|uniref:L-seryl-tRNA(Sec) selenium transferase n=1 Tax=Tepidibacillus decaturensis TaxID=1413211 RepID=A0A135L2Q6_9BACI|nr:L-seryl-tRNA(Sec) selenium transferase [Tepidibacillus decaturensis]KXG43230.1 L-seryl-tRNA(Sec) selenium transferase [Tepidibacillus decaturensis]